MIGQVQLDGSQHQIAPAGAPLYATDDLDDALQFALHQSGAHTAVVGRLLDLARFEVHQWGPTGSLPAPTIITVDAPTMAALSVNGGDSIYFPADLTREDRRWVVIPRLREYYALDRAEQREQRAKWIEALVKAAPIQLPGIAVSRSWLERCPTPVLRLLLAQFAARALPVVPVDQPQKRYRGAMLRGVTVPVLLYPIVEPDCYLPVLAGVEGLLEALNAYDLDAGISIGPIQFNAQRAALFRFLTALSTRDPDLFQQALGGPLAWSVRRHDDHPDLVAGAGAPVVVLHGRSADHSRNAGYFQSGVPGNRGFAQIDASFRRRQAECLRDVVAWPHVQEVVLETSAWWLSTAVDRIHLPANRIPPLHPRRPDRTAFVLKSLLVSATVRYSAVLDDLLVGLRRWPTLDEKLAHVLDTLEKTDVWANLRPRSRDALRTRLEAQRATATRVHDLIQRLGQQTGVSESEEGGSSWTAPIETDEGLLELIDEAVTTGSVAEAGDLLSEVAVAAGWSPAASISAAEVFDRGHEGFEVLARPGETLGSPLAPGDVLVRRGLGEGALAHVAVLATGELVSAPELAVAGLRGEGPRGGYYAHVVEGGATPHRSEQQFARRITDEHGRVARDQMLLRARGQAAREQVVVEPQSAHDLPSRFLEAAMPVQVMLDADAITAARRQLRSVGLKDLTLILQLRAFLRLSVTPFTEPPPDRLSPKEPVFEWFGEDLVRGLASWQAGHDLEPNGKLTAETRAKLTEAGFLTHGWYDRLDERDLAEARQVPSLVGPSSPGQQSGRVSRQQAIVLAATTQIGFVSSLNRGDGRKFGWVRLVEYYRGAGVYSDAYLPTLKKPNNDTSAPGGPWSWCGIFAIWAVKAATGKGAWVGGRPDLQFFEWITGNQGIRTGDIVALTGKLNHHTIVASVSADGSILRTIDGNQYYQGVYPNHRSVTTVGSYYRLK